MASPFRSRVRRIFLIEKNPKRIFLKNGHMEADNGLWRILFRWGGRKIGYRIANFDVTFYCWLSWIGDVRM